MRLRVSTHHHCSRHAATTGFLLLCDFVNPALTCAVCLSAVWVTWAGGNQLRFINDFRDDIANFGNPARQSRRPNCEPFEVWAKGRPHILIMASRPLRQYEELLVDYGDACEVTHVEHARCGTVAGCPCVD
jgi:hypothetical protein